VRCVKQLISFGDKFLTAYSPSVLTLCTSLRNESLQIRSQSEEFLSKKQAVGVTCFEMTAVTGEAYPL